MHKKSLFAVFVAVLLTSSHIVMAQPGPGYGGRGGAPAATQKRPPPAPQRGPGVQRPPQRPKAYQPPRSTRPPAHYNHYKFSQHRRTPHGDIRPGFAVPGHYHHKQYVVADWRRHHLYAPPRGHHWVQVGGDYVLVAIASGIITQILMGY